VTRDSWRDLSLVAWLIAFAGLCLAVWSIWLVPGVAFQPRGLRGALFALSGRRHVVWNGLAIDAPDGYALHSHRLSSGRPSLVLTEAKLPWAWPDLNRFGFAMIFVQPDPTNWLMASSSGCASAQDGPCHVERTAHGDVTCFIRDRSPSNGLDARRGFDCLNARTALEVKFFSSVATVQPIQQALLGPLSAAQGS
jgi:hypothetical protein